MGYLKSAIDVITGGYLGQAIIATLLVGGTVLLLVLGREVPVVLWTLDGTVVAYYFASVKGNTDTNGTKFP